MVRNVHERLYETRLSAAEAGALLIDRLAGRDDALWPREEWPPVRFDRPVGIGARGGHGPVRYTVEEYAPGRSVAFRFGAPRGFVGSHGFEVEQSAPGVVRVRHTLSMRLEGWARLSWPLAYRWLHDALVEDALDRAGASIGCAPARRARWSVWVRLLRKALKLSHGLSSHARRQAAA